MPLAAIPIRRRPGWRARSASMIRRRRRGSRDERHLGPPQRDRDRNAQPAAQQRRRVPVRIGEMGIDHVEREGALQAQHRRQAAQRHEQPVEPLERARHRKEARVPHLDAVLDLDRRCNWTKTRLPAAQESLQRKPGHRRDHRQRQDLRDAEHAFANEESRPRLTGVREQGREDHQPRLRPGHTRPPPRRQGAGTPDDSGRRFAPSCARFRRSGAPRRAAAASATGRRAAPAPCRRAPRRSPALNRTPVSPSADQLPVPADVGRDEQSPLRHRLERLERRDEVGEAHRQPRVHQHVDEVVVPLHFVVRNAAGEHDLVRDAERRGALLSESASCGPPPTRSTRTRGFAAGSSASPPAAAPALRSA